MKFVKAEKSGSAVPKERPAVDSKILAPAMGLGGFSAICQRAEGPSPAGWGINVRLNTHKTHTKSVRGLACKSLQD